MKHLSIAVASACCIAAAPAWADQDTALISQSGTGNEVLIEQVATGGNNTVSVQQGQSWYEGSNGNRAELLQFGVDNARIEVMQSGYNNQFLVHQSNGSNLTASINVDSTMYGYPGGEGNAVQISQSGANAYASVEQGGSYYSRADIWQSGWDGHTRAEIRQWGEGNRAEIDQMGGNNFASIWQAGSSQVASIVQDSTGGYGAGNTATIRQSR